MTKTQKSMYICVFWKIRIKRQFKTPRGAPKRLFHHILILFLSPDGKRFTIKAFPEVILVSLMLRTHTVP